jgi:hypothetical protein
MDLALARFDLALLQQRARRDEIILLYEDETVVWRFALPRRGWWRRGRRYRLPLRPLSPRQIKRQETLKRQAWTTYRTWSRISSGVLLHVIGAVQYGTSRVFYKLVPHFDAQEFRQYIHQIMQVFGSSGKEVVMVTDQKQTLGNLRRNIYTVLRPIFLSKVSIQRDDRSGVMPCAL